MSLPTPSRHRLERAVSDGTVPGLVALASGWETPFTAGRRGTSGETVTFDTRYDLASLTKVVATLPSILRLASDGAIALTDPIGRFFSNAGWMRSPSLAERTLAQLLTHTSGLPAWLPLFDRTPDRTAALAAVLQTPIDERQQVAYSDLGFMLLGAVVERASGERLDEFARSHVFEPLGMTETSFGPIHDVPVAPTEDCGWRGRLLQGEVHDENAWAWQGVAGHAGLFGTASDLGRYCRAWLDLDVRLGNEELLVRATSLQAKAADGSARGLGWMLASRGWFAGPTTAGFGHTGFTGTSLWLDPQRQSWAVLLTNRVHPHRGLGQGIRELRIDFHESL